MYKKIFIFIRKPLAVLLIIGFFLPLFPQKTYAILGAGDTVVVVGDVSPTGINNFINLQMDNLKSFVLDRLATLMAKQILHKMTVDVVNWINNGFEGSPAFLTNPEAFFLDAADQVTGAFLATNGPLSALCEPFNIDIRLSLALSQSQLLSKRYDCTLGRIIEAQKNGPNVTINGQVVRSAQGSSMGGFLGGDFNQGGWPAFIALTTEPQNNPYGAMLQARADLQAQLNSRQNTIRADLQMGSGFMSWQSCKDIPGGTIDPNDSYQVSEADNIVGNDPSIKIKNNKNGTVTYQTCETQTPGSVIAGTLQTNLNVPVVELELADDINAIVNALMNQMVTTMLSSGLKAMSGGGSGGKTSYTQQVIDDINSGKSAKSEVSNIKASIVPAIDSVKNYKSIYDQAVDVITDTKNRYLTAKSCITSKYGNSTQVSTLDIDNAIKTNVDPMLSELKSKQAEAAADLKQLEDISKEISSNTSADKIQTQIQKYSDFVQKGGMNNQAKIDAANAALVNAQARAQLLNTEAARFQYSCTTQYQQY
ncbi:MAG: hypothetical protein WC666_02415 [Candidatus Paceibacterota bacterium]|jgi:hypothetical protein